MSNKERFNPVSLVSEISLNIEISPVLSVDMIHSRKRIIKALIGLCGCAGLAVPLLFANPKTGFLALMPIYVV